MLKRTSMKSDKTTGPIFNYKVFDDGSELSHFEIVSIVILILICLLAILFGAIL